MSDKTTSKLRSASTSTQHKDSASIDQDETAMRSIQTPSTISRNLCNFRDLASANDRASKPIIKDGRLFRSAKLDDAGQKLSAVDKHYLYGREEGCARINLDIDLRKGTFFGLKQWYSSYRGRPCAFIQMDSWAYRWRVIKMLRGFWAILFWITAPTVLLVPIATVALSRGVISPRGLVGLNQDMLAASTGSFRSIFEILADDSHYGIHFFCQQGKDRTGLVVMIILLFMGAGRDMIQQDYLESERRLQHIRKDTEFYFWKKGISKSFADCNALVPDAVNLWLRQNEKSGGDLSRRHTQQQPLSSSDSEGCDLQDKVANQQAVTYYLTTNCGLAAQTLDRVRQNLQPDDWRSSAV